MRYGVTGATGLLGGNLAQILLEAGHEVVATRRPSSKIAHLSAFGIEWAEATLSQPEALSRAFTGCDGVFHCAAAVTLMVEIKPWVHEANVQGTANIIEVVRALEIPRLVHCSTVGALGLSVDGEPSDETVEWNIPAAGLGDAYAMTKRQAQDMVLKQAREEGLDVVVVNPTFMVGPYDARPSTGQIIADLVRGKVPAHTLGTNNFVDVRDVARGLLGAMEKGRAGECYILGGRNMTYKAFLDLVCATTGAPPVTRRAPDWLIGLIGRYGDLQAWITGKEPFLNTASVRWSLNDRFIFKCDKAQRELGYTISPLEPAIEDAVTWFRQNGILPPVG